MKEHRHSINNFDGWDRELQGEVLDDVISNTLPSAGGISGTVSAARLVQLCYMGNIRWISRDFKETRKLKERVPTRSILPTRIYYCRNVNVFLWVNILLPQKDQSIGGLWQTIFYQNWGRKKILHDSKINRHNASKIYNVILESKANGLHWPMMKKYIIMLLSN